MKQKRKYWMLGLVFFLYPFVLYAYFQLDQDYVILHWNAQGIADGFGPKWILLGFPWILVLFDLCLLLAHHFDKKRRNLKSDKTFFTIRIILACFLALFVLLCSILQFPNAFLNVNAIMSILVALLFLCIGNYMPRMRPNWIMGIRTPWTLSDDRIWLKTHRFGGRLWFFGSFLMLLSVSLPTEQHLLCFFVIVLMLGIIPCIYSYILFHKEKVKGESQ